MRSEAGISGERDAREVEMSRRFRESGVTTIDQ